MNADDESSFFKKLLLVTLVYLCTGSLDCARNAISIESTETLKIVTAVGSIGAYWVCIC